jgi:hypothetical protein
MSTSKLKIVLGIVSLLVVLDNGAFAQTGTQATPPTGSSLNAGGIYCLPAEDLANFTGLFIFVGAAGQASGTAQSVKWSVWAGPSLTNPGVEQLYGVESASVGGTVLKSTNPNHPFAQACINNNESGVPVVFSMQQTPCSGNVCSSPTLN